MEDDNKTHHNDTPASPLFRYFLLLNKNRYRHPGMFFYIHNKKYWGR